MNCFDLPSVTTYDEARRMMKQLALVAMLLSQAVWIHAQNGWVLCVHADGQMLTEPAGDLCCDAVSSTPSVERSDHSGQGGPLLGSDRCPCTDHALSFTTPQLTQDTRTDLPSLAVDASIILEISTLRTFGQGALLPVPAANGPPAGLLLTHLATVILRL